ncbi:hypothetical protein PTSG_07263 [Salpingoeca rosetta]|uniref:Uncharacterized protein n=1 Tax=Salpingoeca rosetta (strain ATCC 50818 / BSB-021) TaxID=946362 RepID=F2UEI8_SALR5|nr:uncharacterized protein PTSG_07263 [Salpingoeca rosetta]EGD75038.1 hypothetical protein PTSG_07263 [Salpingoeca rosetta]|eukprot:XP_004992682.1 hypothetical protein PTSG_07263 [Salpingoeca rosetta]
MAGQHRMLLLLALVCAACLASTQAQSDCAGLGENDCQPPCVFSNSTGQCHKAGCAYTPFVDCDAPCTPNPNTLACHVSSDTGGACAEYDFENCPARCLKLSVDNSCSEITCDTYDIEEACLNDNDDLDCTYDADISRCRGTNETVQCTEYSPDNCPADRCDAFDGTFCVEKGTYPSCAFYSMEDNCNSKSWCTWSPLYGACGTKAGEFECGQLLDFLSCVDQDQCCFDSGLCVDLQDGQSCTRTRDACSSFSLGDCPSSYCLPNEDAGECEDPPCLAIRTNRTCSTRNECIFLPEGCRADGEPPCDQYTSQGTCPWKCTWDFGSDSCMARACTDVFDEGTCLALGGCAYDFGRCHDEGTAVSSSTQIATTQSFDIDCSQFANMTTCRYPCFWSETDALCRNRTCTQIFDETACEANAACEWTVNDFFPCTPVDTGLACTEYSRDLCPITRCTLGADDGSGPACRDKTCAELNANECTNSTALACQYDESYRICYPEGEELPCGIFNENDCPARCNYSVGAQSCYQPGTVLPCSRFNKQQFCEQQDECTFYSIVGLCVNDTQPDYQCNLIYNDQFCRDSPICTYGADGCQKCTANNTADCIQPCPDVSLPDCSQLTQASCFSEPSCVYNFELVQCTRAVCTDVLSYDKCLCESLTNCTYDGKRCKYFDDGRPCEEKTTALECGGADPRCFSDYNDETGIFECRNATCADQYGQTACEGFEGAECEWLSYYGLCNDAGAKVPCTRIYEKYACGNSTECTYYSDINLCYYKDEEVPCEKYRTATSCPSDRCSFYPTIPLCAPQGQQVPCSAYDSELACLSNDACRYVPGAYACVAADEPSPCTRISNAVACGDTVGCKHDGAKCVACKDDEACNGTSGLQPCEEAEVCNAQYCFPTDNSCISLSCDRIFSRFYCSALDGCRYDPYTYRCVEESSITDCEDLPNESICTLANTRDNRTSACVWDADYGVCFTEGNPLPCKAFKNETACNLLPYCEFNVVCQDYVTTTTTTTTTTTAYINACDRRPCATNVECTPLEESNTYECGDCPLGYEGDGRTCTLVTCPSQLSLGVGAEYAFADKCFFTNYGDDCNARCDSNYEQIGDGVFICSANGTWIGNLTCNEIDRCMDDPPPCDPLTTCTKVASNSFTCTSCPTGYRNVAFRPKTKCMNINECEEQHPCHPRRNCTDTMGSFECGKCEPGWREVNDRECEDIRECTELEPCYPGVKCTETDGSFACGKCPTGYTGTGVGPDGCEIVRCPLDDVPSYENADVDCAGNVFDSTCTATCKEGYSNSEATIQCKADGQWTTPSLTCSKLPCANQPDASLLPIGVVNPQCAGRHQCTLECKAGYRGEGNPSLTCPTTAWVGDTENPFTCVPCDAGSTYQNTPGSTTCLPVSPPCGEGEYESAAPTTSTNRRCRAVKDTCREDFEYSTQDPTPTSDRVCSTCTACPVGQYRSGGCDGLFDAQCAACSTCGGFSYELLACTQLADTTCATCPFGTFYSRASSRCQDQPYCFVGQIEAVSPTPLRKRNCTRVRIDTPPPPGTVARVYTITLTGIDGTLPLDVGVLLVESVRRVFVWADVDVRVGILSVNVGTNARRRRSLESEVVVRVEASEDDASAVDGTDVSAQSLRAAISAVASDTQGDSSVSRALREAAAALLELEPESVGASNVQPSSTAGTTNQQSTTNSAATTDPQSSQSGGTDNTTLYIIIGSVGGVVLLVVVIAVVVTCRTSGRSKGASISGAGGAVASPYQENNYSNVHELMAMKTLETTARAPVATRATRQGSFYSSITQAASEI